VKGNDRLLALLSIGQQLRYLKRNLGLIGTFLKTDNALTRLTSYEQRCLETVRLLHALQRTMYEKRTLPNRIVNLSQPHLRPIVRGKGGRKIEFGAKVSLSHLKEGYVTVDRLSWDAYHESADLIGQIGSYRDRFGHYPASVHANTIYRTRENLHYCKERGIRLSGKPLGRPKKETAENQEALKALKCNGGKMREPAFPWKASSATPNARRLGPHHGQARPHQRKRHPRRVHRARPGPMAEGRSFLASTDGVGWTLHSPGSLGESSRREETDMEPRALSGHPGQIFF